MDTVVVDRGLLVVVDSSAPEPSGLAEGLATLCASLAVSGLEDGVGLPVEVRWRPTFLDGSLVDEGVGDTGSSGGGGGGLWNWVAGMMISGRVVVVVVDVVEGVVLDGVVGDSATVP